MSDQENIVAPEANTTTEAVDVVQPEAVDPQPVDAGPAWEPEVEEDARLFGWKPPEEWQGEKPEGYIDNPNDYLERVQRSRIFKTMQAKQEESERKLAAMNDQALERQRRQHQAELDRINAEQRRAVEEADVEAFDKLEKQKQDLGKPQDDPPEIKNLREKFISENAWAQNPMLFQEAAYAVTLAQQSGHVFQTPQEQFDYAKSTMEMKYPHLAAKPPAKQSPQRVDGGSLAPSKISGGGSAFDKLPPDAKNAFKRFVSKNIYSDTKEGRDEYARIYNEA